MQKAKYFGEKWRKVLGMKKRRQGSLRVWAASSVAVVNKLKFISDTLHFIQKFEYQEVLTQRAEKGKH